jgi:cell volume regulation protein A
MLPELLAREIYHNRLSDYLICLAILIGGVLVVKIVEAVVLRRLRAWAESTPTTLDVFAVERIQKNAIPLAYLGIAESALRVLTLTPRVEKIVDTAGVVLAGLIGILFALALVRYVFREYMRKQGEDASRERALKGIMSLVNVLVWIIGTIFLLDNLGFRISTVVAGLGIGGIAVALAAQTVLGDLFAYFTILFDRPFEIGDFVIVGEHMGVIERHAHREPRRRADRRLQQGSHRFEGAQLQADAETEGRIPPRSDVPDAGGTPPGNPRTHPGNLRGDRGRNPRPGPFLLLRRLQPDLRNRLLRGRQRLHEVHGHPAEGQPPDLRGVRKAPNRVRLPDADALHGPALKGSWRAAMHVPAVFAVSAAIIFAGFAGKMVFEKTRIPDIPMLLGVGVALGPWLHIMDRSDLLPLAPYLGMLTLLMIMLEGGMGLELGQVLHQMKWAVILTVLTVTLATFAVAAGYLAMTGAPVLQSLLLGAILACTSGAVVIPLVNAMRMARITRTILTLESALGDAMAVVGVVILVRYMHEPSAGFAGQAVATAVAILGGVGLGAVAGIVWMMVLARAGRMPLAYMLTLAAMFLLYAASDSVHVSGIIAVLIFGMTLSNGQAIVQRLPAPRGEPDWKTSRYGLDDTIRWFHEEVTFIARVFFFVYLGMLVDPALLSPRFLGVSAALIALIYLSRSAAVRGLGFLGRRQVPFERKILVSMAPRGLASAVLAMVPENAGIPGTEIFVQYAFAVILATNLFVTAAVLRSERRIDAMLAANAPRDTAAPP